MDKTDTSLPVTNEGWFQRMIADGMKRLEDSLKANADQQRAMHEANVRRMDELSAGMVKHASDDVKAFAEIGSSLKELEPVRKLVYGFVALVLAGVVGALLALVIVKEGQTAAPAPAVQQQAAPTKPAP